MVKPILDLYFQAKAKLKYISVKLGIERTKVYKIFESTKRSLLQIVSGKANKEE